MAPSPILRARTHGVSSQDMYEYPMTRLGSMPATPPRAHVNATSLLLAPVTSTTSPSSPSSGGALPAPPQSFPAGIIRTPNIDATPTRAPPLFAEQLAPSSTLRQRRPESQDVTERSRPLYPEGRSQAGFYDGLGGDLFRGAEVHPGTMDGMSRRPGRGDDGDEGAVIETASSTNTSSSSSSSGSSWSGLSLGRRMTHAMDRVGDALGVRRGSFGASTASVTDSDGDSVSEATDKRRGRRRSKPKKSRTFSLGTRRSDSPDGSTATVKRQRIPTRREFCLVLPADSPHAAANDNGDLGMGYGGPPGEDSSLRGRMTTTPNLAMILDLVRQERLRSGYESRASKAEESSQEEAVEDWDSLPLVRKSHSEEGRARRNRPFASRVPSDVSFSSGTGKPKSKHRHAARVQEIRADAGYSDDGKHGRLSRRGSARDVSFLDPGDVGASIVRPKSASDLLGLQQAVKAAKRQQAFVLPPRPTLGRGLSAALNPVSNEASRATASRKRDQKKACWWLDVSCPGWEDLRDLGELLQLHPLTLEDVLQQDPREKIDVFEQLGYYLIVFRAIDETYFKYTAPDSNPDLLRKQVLATERDKPPRKTNGFLGLGAGIGDFRKSKNARGKLEIVEDHPGKEGLEGVGAGGINLYLVVFKDGVISFHFNDVSKHTDRVRERMLQFADQVTTSDWVAHGLMDSVVDAFFPLVNHIDDEVDEIDTLVIDPTRQPKAKEGNSSGKALDSSTLAALQTALVDAEIQREKGSFDGHEAGNSSDSLQHGLSEKPSRTRRWLIAPLAHPQRRPTFLRNASLRFRLWLLGWRVFLLSRWAEFKATPGCCVFRARWRVLSGFLGLRKNKHYTQLSASKPVYDRTVMLHRMMHIRRLTTGLTRLLGSKHQVVKRLKKRAADNGGEVWAYIGDVQDHIFMLETSLHHFEYILSHCQPAYMSHLSVSFSYARGNVDQLILVLSSVSIGILPMQFLVGMFSMNIRIPANGSPHDRDLHKDPDGSQSPFNYFFSILGGTVLIGIGMVLLIRYWRWRAKMESKMGRTLRGKRQKEESKEIRANGTLWEVVRKKLQ